MVFNKEETKNLLNMLLSEDLSNADIAFASLKTVDVKEYSGELIVLYKFSGHSLNKWIRECNNCGIVIKELTEKSFTPNNTSLSTGTCLSIMTSNNCSNQSIELFLEKFTENMIGFLGQMGYPTDKFTLDIKLKENGQSTKP